MKLSPLDIRKQDFDSALRGYSKDDVEAFLHMMSEQWEELLEEKRRLDDQVRVLQDKMKHYEQVEEALQEALQTARENSEQKIENAEKKARLMVQEAEARADEITREAREDRELLRRQVEQLQARRDEGVASLRAFLMSEMELLLRFDGEDPEALRASLPGDLAQHVSGEAMRAGEPEAQAGPPDREEPLPEEPDLDEPPAEFGEAPAPSFGAGSEAPPGDDSSSSGPSEARGEDPDGADELTDFLRQYEAERIQNEGAAGNSAAAPADAHVEADTDADDPPAAGEAAPSNARSSHEESAADVPTDEPSAEESPAEETEDEDAASEKPAPEPLQGPVRDVLEAREEHGPAEGDQILGDDEDPTATAEEIDQIRRILNDME